MEIDIHPSYIASAISLLGFVVSFTTCAVCVNKSANGPPGWVVGVISSFAFGVFTFVMVVNQIWGHAFG